MPSKEGHRYYIRVFQLRNWVDVPPQAILTVKFDFFFETLLLCGGCCGSAMANVLRV